MVVSNVHQNPESTGRIKKAQDPYDFSNDAEGVALSSKPFRKVTFFQVIVRFNIVFIVSQRMEEGWSPAGQECSRDIEAGCELLVEDIVRRTADQPRQVRFRLALQ